MIKTIKPGKKEFVATCDKCGCQFSYELDDIYIGMVYCPECITPIAHVPNNPANFNTCNHTWEMCNELTTSGIKYRCLKCGMTKIDPYKTMDYIITLNMENTNDR